MKRYRCIDIGGTSIKHACYNEMGEALTETETLSVKQTPGNHEIVDTLHQILKQDLEVDGVAISTAGVVDLETGSIQYAGYTIPDYTGTPLKEIIESTYHIPCFVENDVNCACMGEYWKGAARGASSVVCLTIGTGVGGALMFEGNLWHGASGTAGEVGYIPINNAYFQDLASTTALVEDVMKHHPSDQIFDGRLVIANAKRGDLICQQALTRFVDHLVQGLATIQYLINPQVIVLGGGIMAQQAYLEPMIQAALEKTMIPSFNTANIQFAKLKNDAGMVGALYHFLRRKEG
ncbi:ROK family protein [Erysipelothrix rhusiopathiae]|uniref:ROK family protein n=1 Tax=Erysipelothrix rhusiopathiae TaxID=1648 RepID=UPI000F4318E9|nr:ROK family protein [Erysipelothrix rhusiopathiae]AYV34251.1 ROK family protein [Erysipelothrix rhusiopathiae]MDE8081838.1 ROK family protein [Erysipelothrix rhusiopathiae]MDE8313634.1 ROK family protein [Erysipelothrix rhusiopathiae]MDE8329074.1 ROK family protein [Erysipelothrix rhusiopathiae]